MLEEPASRPGRFSRWATNIFLRQSFVKNRRHIDLTGRSRCLCARDPDQEMGHLRSSGNSGRNQQGRSAGALDNKKEFFGKDF